jgi:hypothetical protein
MDRRRDECVRAGTHTTGHCRACGIRDEDGAIPAPPAQRTATVTLFKESGKYSDIHAWRVPADAIGPWDMKRSPDFNLPPGWTALVDTDASEYFPGAVNWGFPCLLRAGSR